MHTAELIGELELEHTRQRDLLLQVTARLRGIENELEVLRAGGVPGTALSDMARTEAIVEVLRGSSTSMSPSDILAALMAGGRRNEYLSSVTSTLNHLCKGTTVTKIARGQYLAV